MHVQDEILVGRYQIMRHLGIKGFTEAYLAKDNFLPEKPLCVVKQLKPRSLEPETLEAARNLFETEAEVLNKIGSHDQIPELLAYFEKEREFYLIEEFVDGDSLESELEQKQKLSEEQVTNLLQEVLEVLKFVHQENVIHRDIKPSNIIHRRHDKKMVLTGFGAVKQVYTQIVTPEGETSFTMPVGTRGYMPYEQQGGKPRFSSDIYALGVTAIQALTGIHPCQLVENPQTGEINWRTSSVSVSDGLAAILDKMVKSHYRDRYQRVDEVLNDLRKQPTSEFSSHIPVNSDFSSATSAIRPIRNNKNLLILVSIALLLTISGVIAGVVHSRNNPLATRPSTPTAKTTPPASSEPTTAEGLIERGNQRLDSLETKGALADFDKALQLQANSVEAISGKSVAQGWELINKNKFKEALAEFEKAINIKQDNYRAWVGKGSALGSLNQLKEALIAFDKAIEIKPNYAPSFRSRGLVLAIQGKYEEARNVYDQALKIDSKDAYTWYLRGQSLGAFKKYQEAIQSFDKALEINNQYQDALITKGNILFLIGKHKEGLEAVDKAIAINDSYVDAWVERGYLLNVDGRHEGALAAYEKVISIDANNVDAWAGKSAALVKLRRLDEAIKAGDEAIKVSPNIPLAQANAWNVKANALYESGKYDEALTADKKVVEFQPQVEVGWSNLSELLNRIKKYDQALVAADKALNIEQTIGGWNQRGNALVGLGKYLDAIAAYDQVFKLKPDYDYAWIGKGNAFYKLGKYQEAIAAYDKALEIQSVDRKRIEKPDKFATLNQKGNALLQLKKYDEALTAYQEAVKIKPDFAEGYFNQGKTLQELKKFPDALAAYDKALGIKPNYPEAKTKREEVSKKLGGN